MSKTGSRWLVNAVVIPIVLVVLAALFHLSYTVGKLEGSLKTAVQEAIKAEVNKEDGVFARAVREAVAAELNRTFLEESIGDAVEERLAPVVGARFAEFNAELRERLEQVLAQNRASPFSGGSAPVDPGSLSDEKASRPPQR